MLSAARKRFDTGACGTRPDITATLKRMVIDTLDCPRRAARRSRLISSTPLLLLGGAIADLIK